MPLETRTQDYSTATQGSVFLITSDGRTLQLPIPSQSQHDPLTWSKWKRFRALCAISVFTVVGLVQVQGTSLLLDELEHEYNAVEIAPLRVDTLSSVPCIFWGIGALTWVPLSLVIGRRPVFLICTILLTFSTYLAAVSQTFYVHLLARCLQGTAGAISPSTMILTVIEMNFIHQRPRYIASFWCLTTVFSNVGLAVTPYILSLGTWRSFYWIWLGPCALTIFLALFWSPETYFERPAMAFDGHILSQAENGRVKVYSKWEDVPGGKPMPDTPHTWKTSNIIKNIIFWNRTKMGGWPAMKAFPRQLIICLFNPLIFWVLILNAFIFGSMVVTLATYVEVLMAPPYNFSFNAIGLVKFSPAIGALVAFPVSGFLTSWMVQRLARGNKGVREPEHYLPSFIVPVLTSSSSLCLFGVAMDRHWSSIWILVLVGVNYFSAISIFTANTLWVTEAFPRWAAPAIVVVGAGGYAVSFGLSTGIFGWIQSQGLSATYIELGMVTFAVGLVGLPINFWGKQCRQYIYKRWGDNDDQ
ncbi:major facilitator superfamily transporter [Mollisia scopiformis]|uniref:Major facilitator superfamily transporter n=1 Tax=Mollisia scopiformis TaxID=149040 RepID=A0A132B3F8_MOLSC|nr:major facilitator superfamily transporter [Mollisia scopiformis]KUJ06922.1 major facilitator superfamily transporter [Mollisia scopiformis]